MQVYFNSYVKSGNQFHNILIAYFKVLFLRSVYINWLYYKTEKKLYENYRNIQAKNYLLCVLYRKVQNYVYTTIV